jgi:thioredoxin 1
MSKVTEVTSKDFNEFIAEGVAVIDYWATWCGPCRMVAPVIEQLADEMPEVKVGKVNVDDEKQLAKDAEVQAIPNICIYKDGKLVDRLVGVQPIGKFKETIQKYL